MDNYLSYRWPGQQTGSIAAPDPVPGIPRKQKKPRKKRRVLRRLLITLLILVIIAGIGVGSWFLVKEMLPQWLDRPIADAQPSDSSFFTPEGSAPEDGSEEEKLSAPAIERAEIEEGISLELTPPAKMPLPPSTIYEQVLPSVVIVSVFCGDDVGYSGGTGIVMSEDGYILTNYHVVEKGQEATVTLLSDEISYPAKLVGYDEGFDIAILKIDAGGLTPALFGDSDALSVGDPAYAIGNPIGYLYGSMSEGIISYLDRAQTVGEHEMTLIQTTAVLNSGNSGGPLVNEYGQVIGVAVAKISGSVSGSAPVEGVGFAIPISMVRPYINRILATGETWRPTIGITCYEAELDGMSGIMVVTVDEGTPAFEAGLSVDDLIIAANGKPVDSLISLKRELAEVGVGGTLTCTVIHRGSQKEISFTLIDSSELG